MGKVDYNPMRNHYKARLETQGRKIRNLKPGQRAWAPYMVRDLDGPCYPGTIPWTTTTAYIERTKNGFKRLWVRGWFKRIWIWYFGSPYYLFYWKED